MNHYRPMQGALTQVFNDLEIKCKYEECGLFIKLDLLENNQKNCQDQKCVNFSICQNIADPVLL